MIFYFRLIDQPHFMLDLNYKDEMTELVRIIRRQASLPCKRNDVKITFESKISRPSIMSSKMEHNIPCISRSHSHKSNSSVFLKDEQEKSSWSISNSNVIKYFGPFFEEYRLRKAEMKIELLGPCIPFVQPQLKYPNESSSNLLVDEKDIFIHLKPLEIPSNDTANSIIDGTQSTTKAEAKVSSGEDLNFRNSVVQHSNSDANL